MHVYIYVRDHKYGPLVFLSAHKIYISFHSSFLKCISDLHHFSRQFSEVQIRFISVFTPVFFSVYQIYITFHATFLKSKSDLYQFSHQFSSVYIRFTSLFTPVFLSPNQIYISFHTSFLKSISVFIPVLIGRQTSIILITSLTYVRLLLIFLSSLSSKFSLSQLVDDFNTSSGFLGSSAAILGSLQRLQMIGDFSYWCVVYN